MERMVVVHHTRTFLSGVKKGLVLPIDVRYVESRASEVHDQLTEAARTGKVLKETATGATYTVSDVWVQVDRSI